MTKAEITNHILVPKHVVVSEKEKKELLEQYNISLEELPSILKDDAAIKHPNAKPGDIIKIIRNSSTAGEAVFYRVVVSV